MSSVASANDSNPVLGGWAKVAPYVAAPMVASVAVVPVFGDMMIKSALQKGEAVPVIRAGERLRAGFRAAPTAGGIVGTQMVLQGMLEKRLSGGAKEGGLSFALTSSAIVGTASAPFLAIFNGQTMGWSIGESMRRFSVRQGAAIALQESAFVGGLSVADRLSSYMRKRLGDHKAIDYTAAFLAGSLGSLAGHPANTALTLWQSGRKVENASQLMRGALYKARAMGGFSVLYSVGKEVLLPQGGN